ncbi:MAG: FliI/YscN family ATPase [Myxococcota bacterium]
MDLKRALEAVASTHTIETFGRVQGSMGLALKASIPGGRIGELVEIVRDPEAPLLAEIVAFDGPFATILPLGDLAGTGAADRVRPLEAPLTIRASAGLLGRVLDGLGRPIDGGAALEGEAWDVVRSPPAPLERRRVRQRLDLGIRALDAFATAGEGQRLGIFAGSGVGKTSLLAQIARQANADVFVACLIGERGREVREFLEDALGEEGRKRGVVVCATSDVPALVRMKSAHVATAIAEWFAYQGNRVVLMMDSLTRFVRAGREVGLAAGEPPTRRGYPPSAFSALAPLLERAGTIGSGSITAFYTVLVEGGDLDEPVADEVRGLVDGHLVLDRELMDRGRRPAIDVLRSLSRLMPQVVDAPHLEAAQTLRRWIGVYEAKRDLVLLGAYKRGGDRVLDRALDQKDAIEAFLQQGPNERSSYEDVLQRLIELSDD